MRRWWGIAWAVLGVILMVGYGGIGVLALLGVIEWPRLTLAETFLLAVFFCRFARDEWAGRG